MDSYWSNHSLLFLIGLTIFPRLTLLFANVSSSILFWIGWLFIPRIMIAFLATFFYWETNTILVLLSWLFAFGGESAEKKYGYKIKNKYNNKERNAEFEIVDE
tara:strand:+ start:801 stop:1109 length:309 start_codon:yes stop_codon:yes gene_type:complete